MARRASKNRKKKRGLGIWVFRAAALLVLVAIAFAAWFWWDMRSWRPDTALYPEQGAVIANGTSGTRFETLAATGAGFVYLKLGGAGGAPDPGFAARLSRARSSALQTGISMPFDPCLKADAQSARFTRMVPRDAQLLSPALELRQLGSACVPAVSDAAVEAELMTLINQIEMHAGKPVILRLSRDFELRHNVARMIERDLWLERDRARPDYAGRPWLLWSANGHYVSEASETPIEWVVVQR
ncbi:glycoside hydrolase family 25 protein [Erythrobacter sp. SCSIO 43205]|uniref:glycoside hydrolase family 25 protein n=1 Tax=Erythrobacter sp. SCSIO 43205 TaxID=2779361 RepID=UPI001CA8B890|nr:glycoside hydrolase family 25 protein [Erythrobacter sp. SCSIO 43205]UAB78216.1 glycoside hydrolase family 25 protein [Erythrobacter sp. SCSIO 43205]